MNFVIFFNYLIKFKEMIYQSSMKF